MESRQTAPGQMPEVRPERRGWLATAGMLLVVYFVMKGFMTLAVGGVAGALIGAAVGAAVAWGLERWWGRAHTIGRLTVLLAGGAIVFVGMVLGQMAGKPRMNTLPPPVSGSQEAAPPGAAPAPLPWEQFQAAGQLLAPAVDVQAEWDADIAAWAALNGDFLSEPVRRDVMERHLFRWAADERLGNAEVIARAEAAAFAETGWPSSAATPAVAHLVPKSDRCWKQYLAAVGAVPEDAPLGDYARAEARARERLERCE